MSVADPPAENSDGAEAVASQHGDHPDVGAPGTDLPIASDLGLAALLASDQAGAGLAGETALPTDMQAYDGHVALALDPVVLPDIENTLDLLTTSHHLFDVPAMDIAVTLDDGVTT